MIHNIRAKKNVMKYLYDLKHMLRLKREIQKKIRFLYSFTFLFKLRKKPSKIWSIGFNFRKVMIMLRKKSQCRNYFLNYFLFLKINKICK